MEENYQNEYKTRLKRLLAIKKAGVNPYPAKFDKKNSVSEIKTAADGAKLQTAGRIMTLRLMGKLCFAHLQDFSGKAQIAIKADEVGPEQFKLFQEIFDMGDFIGCEGEVFTTHKGEKTLLVKKFELLSKALLPLPEKWHGLKDEEERLRKRYLDMIANQEVKEIFIKKARYYQAMREFLQGKGFMEVETPALENTTGGADARPFVTHHNALDMDVYLRISVGELWQKRLMVAGFEKTFEIGRIFRNEGMDAEHLQDYTSMEFYWAYADWNDSMKLTEELVKYVAKETFGTLKFKIKNFEIDLSKKWERYDYCETIKKFTGVDIEELLSRDTPRRVSVKAYDSALQKIKTKLHELKVEYENFNNLERGIDNLWKYCRKNIAGPGFVVYLPKIISPLAKESPVRPGYVERYQLILAGSELCNGFSELNDPLDQEERFRAQAELRVAGDEEAQMNDDDFVEALKHGMPPTTGLGISERLFAFLMDKPMRECQIFPLMRPRK